MKNIFKVIILTAISVFIFYSCVNNYQSAKYSKEMIEKYRVSKTKAYPKNNFKNVIEDTLRILGEDVVLNSINFNGSYTAFYTSKVMYDEFGKWDVFRYDKEQNDFICKWENRIMTSDSLPITIYTTGEENKYFMYSGFSATDVNGNDLLTDGNPYKPVLTRIIGNLIRANDSAKKDFYTEYWELRNSY
jgi:hypothetical protein